MNANQINAMFRRAGLHVRIASGNGYYYWMNEKGELVDAKSVYVYRASHITPADWLKLANEIKP